MSTNAAYASTIRAQDVAVCSAANTAFDGTGTIVTLFTAGSTGSRVDQIGWCAQVSTTAGILKAFTRASSTDSWRLITCIPVAAATLSATVLPWQGGITNLNWILGPGAQIGIATHNAEAIAVHVSNAGDF